MARPHVSTAAEAHATLLRRVLVMNAAVAAFAVLVIVLGAITVSGDVGRFQEKGMPVAIILVGSLMFFTSALGFEGARYNQRTASLAYLVVLMLVMATTVVAMSIIFGSSYTGGLSERWGHTDYTLRLNLQHALECCGFNTVLDRPAFPCESQERACQEPLQENIKSRMRGLGVLTIVMLLIEVVAFGTVAYLFLRQQELERVQSKSANGPAAPAFDRQALLGTSDGADVASSHGDDDGDDDEAQAL